MGKINYKFFLIIFLLVQSVYVQSSSRNEEFIRSLSTACQNEDAEQFFEMISIPLLVILPEGVVIRIATKEDFLNNLNRIFVKEFLEECSQFGENSWFNVDYPLSPFSFMKRVYVEGKMKINLLNVDWVIENQRRGFFDWL